MLYLLKLQMAHMRRPSFYEGIPFLSAESVQNDNRLNFDFKRGFISEELHAFYCKKCKPQQNDIFIVKSGATTGRIAIVETDDEFSIWSPLALVRANTKVITPKYFTFAKWVSSYIGLLVHNKILGWE